MDLSSRDRRLDFFRGLGLLVIYSNHIAEVHQRPALMFCSWRPFGFSDAAELFVFISGFIFGLVYYKTFLNEGFWGCQRKALRRCLQIYLANLAALVATLAIVRIFGLQGRPFIAEMGLASFFRQPGPEIIRFLMLDNVPALFDVLVMYVFFLLLMPALMALAHRRLGPAVAISLILYGLAHQDPLFRLSGHFRVWTFDLDPLAWQFLFFVGMILGMKKRRGTLTIPVRRLWIGVALAVLAAAGLMNALHYAIAHNLAGLSRYPSLLPWLPPLAGKLKLEPLRLIHFFSLAYLARCLLPQGSRFFATAPARAVEHCGRNSLKIFCLGLVISYIVCLYFEAVPLSLPVQLFVIVNGWGAMIVGGRLIDLGRERGWVKTLNPRSQKPGARSQEL